MNKVESWGLMIAAILLAALVGSVAGGEYYLHRFTDWKCWVAIVCMETIAITLCAKSLQLFESNVRR